MTDEFQRNKIDALVEDLLKSSPSYRPEHKPIKVADELARRENLKNQDLEQDIKLKKFTLKVLLVFLLGESIVIFVFAFFQATHCFEFNLEEWSFKLLITATITQIYLMLRVAVEYLFPPRNKE